MIPETREEKVGKQAALCFGPEIIWNNGFQLIYACQSQEPAC